MKGVLLVNLGTPSLPTYSAVGRYLLQFLSDYRVIDLPSYLRYLLLLMIVPFRAKRSAHAYQQIWLPEGSPLLYHCQMLTHRVQAELGKNYRVALGMRYGAPSIPTALASLADCDELTVLPLYPQYASASTGSSFEAVFKALRQRTYLPTLRMIHAFYDHSAYLQAQAQCIEPYLQEHDFILFSYHGLPIRHLPKACAHQPCQNACPLESPTHCYRSQCFITSAALAKKLKLSPQAYATTFQSRLGRLPWIQPDTNQYLISLRQKGIKRLLIACPSFTADCLETLEEIGKAAREQWMSLGGSAFTLVPSLNASKAWVEAIMTLIK